MTGIILFVAQQVAAYGINRGLDKIFSSREDFSDRLVKIITLTIEEYQQKYPVTDQGKKFAFYKSQIIIEEFLKFRLFSINGYKIDVKSIQSALEQNPNILKPSEEEIELFFQIFDKHVKTDEKLRKLEIEAFHKEAIFEIYDRVDKILNILERPLIDVIPLLENEYKAEIKSFVNEIKELRPRTALKHLESLEERISENAKHVSNKVLASLKFYIGVCFEASGLSEKAYENFINAYKVEPENKQYLDKACISYYFIKNDKYKDLKKLIEKQDEFNVFCWSIDVFESEDPIDFIKNIVPKIVLEKNHFKRLVFNNYLRNDKVDSLNLIKLLAVSRTSKDFPETINYDNLFHWVFVLNTLSIQFFTSNEIPFWGFVERNEKSIQLLELSKILSEAIKNSELDKAYNNFVFSYYWFQSEIDFHTDTLHNLKEAYSSLKERDSFRTMLYANAVQKHENIENALQIINEFQGEFDENLFTLKTFCQLDKHQSKETVIEYFKHVNHADELNIQNLCGYLLPITHANILEKEELVNLLKTVQFSKPIYQDLVMLLVDTFYLQNSPTIEISKIDEVKAGLRTETRLFFFIAFLYFENKYFEECIKFQESYVDEEKESRDLFLYIRVLDSIRHTNQLTLLRLLKKWRNSFSYNDFLLRIELEIQQILKDWKEIEVITKYALSKAPDDESFYTLYLISLFRNNKIPDLSKEIEKIMQFNFVKTENTLKVVNILMRSEQPNIALELIYKKAVNKTDSLARVNYLSLTANLPPEYFIEYDKVTDDCFVKLEIDGEIETFQITPEKTPSPIVQKSVGKSKLETFTVETGISGKFKNVRILRIMNKYIALSDDIYTQAQSSFSNLPVESVKFETTDKEGIEKTLIENYGPIQEARRKQVEDAFKKYETYDISFSELVLAVFDDSFVEAYYTLISNQSEGFFVKPLRYLNKSILTDNKKFVIDFTSGLLFYELSERLGLSFNNFIVSENIYSLIDNLIAKIDAQKNSNMAINIYDNKIIPQFFPENFHKNRIEFFQKLKNWFRNNSGAENPKEKLDVVRPLYADGKMTPLLEFMVDNAFLAQRENYVLITDDIGYEKMLKVTNWVTTEKYLLNTFQEKKNEILEVMLSFRYVGISVNSDLLYSTFINHHKEGFNHIYNYALRNLSFPANFSPFTIFIAVDFLKKLALNSVLTNEKYKYEATNLLAMLISGFPNPSFGLSLKNRIIQQFNLLGDYLNITLTAFLDALRIIKSI